MITSEQVRANLERFIRERELTATALSVAIRRNKAYIHQFITRGSPAKLDEEDRRVIAAMLDVPEAELGGPEPQDRDLVEVRRLAVEVSAGPGAMVDRELPAGRFCFERAWLKRLTPAKLSELSLVRIKGDSMAPTLADGDDLLVDYSQRDPRARDGVYVLRRDEALMVKRLTMSPASATITISSDNPAHPTWRDCALDSIEVVGRAIWSSGLLR